MMVALICCRYNDGDVDDYEDDQLSIRSSLAVTEVKVVQGQPSVAENPKAEKYTFRNTLALNTLSKLYSH